jgi:hypothetical protein
MPGCENMLDMLTCSNHNHVTCPHVLVTPSSLNRHAFDKRIHFNLCHCDIKVSWTKGEVTGARGRCRLQLTMLQPPQDAPKLHTTTSLLYRKRVGLAKRELDFTNGARTIVRITMPATIAAKTYKLAV